MSNNKIYDQLNVCLNIPGINGKVGVPLMLWGSPGSGKSEIIRQFVTETLKLHFEVVILSFRDPTDVSGLPVIKSDGVEIEPPAWAKRLHEKGGGVIFFDELSVAPPAVQGASLRIAVERVVGDLELPKTTRIIGAGNPPEESAGGWDLTPPMANRFVHLNFNGVGVDDWVDWLLTGRTTQPRRMNFDNWEKEFAKAKSLVGSFIMRNRSLLGPTVPEEPSLASRGWASPRSWDMATHLIAGCAIAGIDRYELLSGCIGEGNARAFEAFSINLDLPDPEELIAGKVKFEHDKQRPDKTLIVLNTLVSYVSNHKNLADDVWKIMDEIVGNSKDLMVTCAKSMVNMGLHNSPTGLKVLCSFGEYFGEMHA